MKLVDKKISLKELHMMAESKFGNLVKAVVDVKKKIMVVDAELHADQEAYLINQGSKQEDLWGINLYPEKKGKDWIEFDSMINLRPAQHNLTRGVDDLQIRKQIEIIVNSLVTE
jgi:hypothetical protein